MNMTENTVCIANIGPRQRRLRLGFGLVMLGVLIAILAWLLHVGAPRPWRLLLFLPLAGSAAGIFQATGST